MAVSYKIFPPIGFARVGNGSPDFIIGREQIGRKESQIDSAGVEIEAPNYKASDVSIHPLAARFRVFANSDDGTPPKLIDSSSGAQIEWTVTVANRKNAVRRSGPPSAPDFPVNDPTHAGSAILPGTKNITGSLAGPVPLSGGSFRGVAVTLGELRTDANSNLLVVGAQGFSSSVTGANITSFYNNESWHDDSCDGSVQATVRLANGDVIQDVSPAWVVSGPPDFAPAIEAIVTLYDVMREVAALHFGQPITSVSFTRDIYPIINRASELKWVNPNPAFSAISTDWLAMSDTSSSAATLRSSVRADVDIATSVINSFEMPSTQVEILDRFEAGTFVADWVGPPTSSGIVPDELTRVALDCTVGSGFYPGIEAGIIVRNKNLYSTPFEFRINSATVHPGDLTALMAVPWQADFFACSDGWWPSQRPNTVKTGTGLKRWDRGVMSMRELVDKFHRLGFIVPELDATGNTVLVERQRDPGL